MKNTSIDFLLFDDLRFLEALQSDYELLNPLVHLVLISAKYMLEVLICSLVNFLCALSRANLSWKKDGVLGH